MPLRTDTKTLVMAALLDGPRHGYALVKAMQDMLPQAYRLAGGQVYIALRGLEAEGLVAGEWGGESVERRVYRLTGTGEAELAWRTAEWHACAEAIARMLPRRSDAALV